MPKLESQKNTKIFSLTETVLEAFCDDISSMFGMSLDCEAIQQQEQADLEDLRKKFRKISAAFKVSSKGFLNGDFWVLLDTVGLFVLSGVFVMLPEKVVAQRAKSGTMEEANNIDDALGEVGNMLVGSWDRVYREELDGHEHLLQTHTAVNEDWASLLETLDISDESVGYQTFKIDVDSYDPVNMTIVYPQSLFDEASQESQDGEDVDNSATENNSEVAQETTETAQIEETVEQSEVMSKEESQEVAQTEESIEKSEAATKEEPQETADDVDNSQETQPESEDKSQDQESLDDTQNQEVVAQETQEDEAVEESDSETSPDAQDDSKSHDDTQAKDDNNSDENVVAPELESPAQGPVSQAIKEMVSSNDAKSSGLNLNISDIMIKDVVWASKDDSVEKIISLMQSQDTGYVLIGSDQVVEGVVSGSDVKGAISPYLQSMFANWRRPQDLATLQIKAKWIMSCAVNTVALDAKFSAAARLLYEKDLNVLPVTDKSGKVCGVITSDEVMRIFMLNIGIDADRPMRRAPIL